MKMKDEVYAECERHDSNVINEIDGIYFGTNHYVFKFHHFDEIQKIEEKDFGCTITLRNGIIRNIHRKFSSELVLKNYKDYYSSKNQFIRNLVQLKNKILFGSSTKKSKIIDLSKYKDVQLYNLDKKGTRTNYRTVHGLHINLHDVVAAHIETINIISYRPRFYLNFELSNGTGVLIPRYHKTS